MTVSFNRLNASGHLFTHCPTSTISSSATPTPPTSWTRKPVAAFLLQSPPRRRLTQAHRPGFARHPHHEDAGTRLHGADRLRQGRRQHRGESSPFSHLVNRAEELGATYVGWG
jgi:hypothetical protein